MKNQTNQNSLSPAPRSPNKDAVSGKLEGLKNDAASHELESGSTFMKPEPPKKRGPYKKRDEPDSKRPEIERTKVDPIQESMQLTGPLVEMYSNMLVQIAEDERARLNSETKSTMVHTSAVVINQYFGGIGEHAALITLAMVTASTSFNAWKLRAENLEKLREEKRQRDKNNGASPINNSVN